MKRFVAQVYGFLLLVACIGHVHATDLPVEQVEFIRKSFIRNYYNLRLPYAQINLRGTNVMLKNANNLEVQQWGDGTATLKHEDNRLTVTTTEMDIETAIRCSDFNPYMCYEVDIDHVIGEQGVTFYTDREEKNERIIVYKRRGFVGVRTSKGEREVKDPHDGPLTLRVQFTGQRLHAFIVTEHTDSLAMSFDVPQEVYSRNRFWHLKDLTDWNFGAYAHLHKGQTASFSRVEAAFTCGTGQADPAIVQEKDGTPYIRDGKLYVMLTTRGFELIPDSHQGIYRLDLTTYQWELAGTLLFTRDGDEALHSYHATKAVWDGNAQEWLLMTVSHGEDHCLMQGRTKMDILHGYHVMDVTALNEPHNDTRTNEDPDFLFDAKENRWLLAYVSIIGGKGYQTVLATADQWNGPYQELAVSQTGNETGTRLLKDGDTYKVLSGGDNYNVLAFPTLQSLGTLHARYPDGGFRGWATVARVPNNVLGGEQYIWITFDRGRITGRYSYGSLYVFVGK